ncbi:MAG: hypothetical protein ACR2M3_04915 [Thermomicrobiales bacterium]
MSVPFSKVRSRYIRWDSPVGWSSAAVAALGALLFPGVSTWLWVVFFLIAAALCSSSYIERCGRVHCRVTGPFFLLCAAYLALVELDLVPFMGNVGFVAIVMGVIALSFLAELAFGKYMHIR